MRSGKVKGVFVGADRITAHGDVANKIGTYQLAVLAKENGIPFTPLHRLPLLISLSPRWLTHSN